MFERFFRKRRGSKVSYEYACSCRTSGCDGSLVASKTLNRPCCPFCGAMMDLVRKTVYSSF